MAILTLTGLLALLAPPADDEPSVAALVARLGAPRQAERDAAGEALLRVGRAALPELLKVGESGDAEVRQRAAVLVARIEAGEILGATLVRLNVRDRPPTEAAQAIERASGIRIRPGAWVVPGKAAAQPSWPADPVTLVAAGPVPFWEAIDRLCEAAGLQRQYSPTEANYYPWVSPLPLTLVPGRGRPPASDTGALRVELLRVLHDLDRDYGDDYQRFVPPSVANAAQPDPETGAAVGSFYRAELLVSAEPRLLIIGVGRIEDVEAVDDRGRSLKMSADEQRLRQLVPLNFALDPAIHPELRYGTADGGGSWNQVTVPLVYPSSRAARIARLRGVLPVAVLARRPGPLEVELEGAVGKTFGPGPTRITVHKITPLRDGALTVDLTLEAPPAAPDETIAMYDQRGGRLRVRRPAGVSGFELEVVDGLGEPRYWQFSRSPSERTRGRMAIIVHGRRPKDEAARAHKLRLRYWETAGAVTDLSFSFTDVPTP